jgi:hypothetical protein
MYHGLGEEEALARLKSYSRRQRSHPTPPSLAACWLQCRRHSRATRRAVISWRASSGLPERSEHGVRTDG